MSQVAVGTVQHAEIGHVLDADSIQGLSAIIPHVGERATVPALHLDWMHEVDGLEAGGADEEVEFRLNVYNIFAAKICRYLLIVGRFSVVRFILMHRFGLSELILTLHWPLQETHFVEREVWH